MAGVELPVDGERRESRVLDGRLVAMQVWAQFFYCSSTSASARDNSWGCEIPPLKGASITRSDYARRPEA